MQLDKTNIAIRERSLLEIMDLALHVIRAYFPAWLICLAMGSAPWLALNAWLLSGWDLDDRFAPSSALYVAAQMTLVMLEAPLASAPLTLMLGQKMFRERVDFGRMVRDLAASLPQVAVFGSVVRALCTPLVVTLAWPLGLWPYVNEVILLERNPARSRRPRRWTTLQRCRVLHRGASGDLFARWMATTGLTAALTVSLCISIWTMLSVLTGRQHSAGVGLSLYLPVALWLVVGYGAVARFLLYLDLRIRREGWEVELSLRAEAARLARI